MPLEEHVSIRELAVGCPARQVLYVTLRSTFHSGHLPSDSQGREVLHVTLEVHVLFRALALGLPDMEVP